jgi:ABC-2 type transport system permease protein
MTVASASETELVPVRVPERSVRNDLRAIKIVWQREMIRFFREKPRLFASLLQPMLYLFVFGTGLSSMVQRRSGVDLRLFLFPGVMTMAVLFTCFFSAGSIVWDREFGFMREMLVAPVRREAIVLGKCLGGATAGGFQGLVVLATGVFLGVPYSVGLVVTILAELLLVAFALTSMAVVIAARIRSMQSFMALVQMVLMPLFFLSGALYPLRGLPPWLAVLTRLDPLTYAVDALRRAMFASLPHVPQIPGVTWFGWTVPVGLDLTLVTVSALLAFSGAVFQFNRSP